jgi:hypothetical protein
MSDGSENGFESLSEPLDDSFEFKEEEWTDIKLESKKYVCFELRFRESHKQEVTKLRTAKTMEEESLKEVQMHWKSHKE